MVEDPEFQAKVQETCNGEELGVWFGADEKCAGVSKRKTNAAALAEKLPVAAEQPSKAEVDDLASSGKDFSELARAFATLDEVC